MRYRKKPVVIQAVQWTGQNIHSLNDFMGDTLIYENQNVYINTLEGKMHASVNDYIIRGVQGEFYACKPDIFEMTYEVA
jgi:hypothetical protein